MRIALLNLDDSLPAQRSFMEFCANQQADMLDLKDLGARMRMLSGRKAMREFSSRLDAWPFYSAGEPVLSFMGSGDFHHLSAELIGKHTEPVTVIHFDNHPDFIRLAPPYHCASWINRVLEMAHVQRIITVGPCTDLRLPQLELGNLDAVMMGRLEIYPYRHGPSTVFGGFGSGPSHRQRGYRIVWRNLHNRDWDRFWSRLLHRVPTQNVYVSIDKDVLANKDAATNWDQGEMTLEQMLRALALISHERHVIGADVVGDYSATTRQRPLRRLLAWLDHPRTVVETPCSGAVNGRTNIALASALCRVPQRTQPAHVA